MGNYSDFIGDSTVDLNGRVTAVETTDSTLSGKITTAQANIATLTTEVNGLLAAPSRTVIGHNDIGVDYQSTTIQVSKVGVVQLPKKSGQCENLLQTMMVLLSSGALVGWGDNTPGLLANGHYDGDNLPQQVLWDPLFPPALASPTNATIVDWAITGGSAYVVFSDGTVYSSGYNTFGQLGHGNTTQINYFKKLQWFIAYQDGTAASSGSTVTGTSTKWVTGGVKPGDLIGWGTDPHSISTWYTIQTVGENLINLTTSAGTHASGSYVIIPQTKPVMKNVWAVGDYVLSGQGGMTLFCDTNNTLWSCGRNSHGNLGWAATTDQPTPGRVTQTGGAPFADGVISDVQFVSADDAFSTYVLTTNGHLWACGFNSTFQLGDGTSVQKTQLTNVTPGNPAPVCVTITGTVAAATTAVTGVGTGFVASGVQPTGMQIGFHTTNPASVSAPTSTPGTGWFPITAVANDTHLTIGNNSHGASAGTIVSGTAFVITWVSPAKVIRQISVTGGHNGISLARGASAIVLDNVGDVFTVGFNASGQCGVGNTTTVQAWVRVTQNMTSVGTGNGMQALCWSIDASGILWNWGDNGTGALFTGTLVDKHTPSKVVDLNSQNLRPTRVISSVCDAHSSSDQAMLMVLTADGLLHAAGNLHSVFGILDPAYTNYAYVVPYPASIISGAESIADWIWRGDSTSQARIHILTTVGNIYAAGDQSNGAITGGYATSSVPAAYQWIKVDLPIGVQTPQSIGTGNSEPDPVTPLHGGTGVNILPAHALVVGEGLSPVSGVLPGPPGDRLVSNGVDWVSGDGVSLRVMEIYPRAQGSSGSLEVRGFDPAGQTQSGVISFGTTAVYNGLLAINPLTSSTLKIFDYAGYTNPVLMKPIWDFVWAFGPTHPDSGLYWCALANGDISATTTPASTVGVYVQGSGTGTYVGYVHDGAALSIFDTGIDTGGSIVHRFRFDMSDGNTAKFYMDGDLVHIFPTIPNAYLGYHYSAQAGGAGNVDLLIGRAGLVTG